MRKVDLDTASGHFGLSKDAIRKRIKRGSLEGERDKAGRWWVIIPDETDNSADETDAYDLLFDELRARVIFLEKELERKDTIIMSLMSKVPQLEAPRENQVGDPRLPWWKNIFQRRK